MWLETPETPAKGPLQTGEKGGVIQPHQRLRLVPRDAPDQEDSPSCMGSRASGPVGETLEARPAGSWAVLTVAMTALWP